MKQIALSLMLCAILVTAFAQVPVASVTGSVNIVAVKNATFNWKQTTFDFGKIKQNAPVTHEFNFVNNGDTPLVITSVKASCGCTVAEYTKDPIAPGAAGFVKATYNAAAMGVFTKTVTINANTEEGVVLLTIKGEVVN